MEGLKCASLSLFFFLFACVNRLCDLISEFFESKNWIFLDESASVSSEFLGILE